MKNTSIGCFLYSDSLSNNVLDFSTNEVSWGNCCEELSIVPKPFWIVLLLTLPIEGVVATAPVGQTSMFDEKQGNAAYWFVFFSFATLVTILLEYPWESCKEELTIFECYQGVVFSFYNSTAALATLTGWMLTALRRVFSPMFRLTKFILFPDYFWKQYLNSRTRGENYGAEILESEKMKKQYISLIQRWNDEANKTKLFWYDFVMVGITFLFGGITHVLVGAVIFFYLVFWLVCSLTFSHILRTLAISLDEVRSEKEESSSSYFFRTMTLYYFGSLVISAFFLILSPLRVIYLFFEKIFNCSSTKKEANDDEIDLNETRLTGISLESKSEKAENDVFKEANEFNDLANTPLRHLALSQNILSVANFDFSSVRLPKKPLGRVPAKNLDPDPRISLRKKKSEIALSVASAENDQPEDNLRYVKQKAWKTVIETLRNLCLYDPEGRLIVYAAATVFILFSSSANYAILFYSGAPYVHIPFIDFWSRRSSLYFQCTLDNFEFPTAFGLLDFIGVALTILAGLVQITPLVLKYIKSKVSA
eukprot:snap_masked-scaffold_2-processed-gene-26.19-mRNA-1 protein AED:1.00 eAED:1.00 QI:0/-1/0/0/-1/1/1/0/535